MKTNQKRSIVSLLALGVLAAGFSAKPASAQVLEGKFTLPSEVHWGLATLPAGDYSLTLDKSNTDGMVSVSRGSRPVALILPQGLRDAKSERCEIVAEAGIVRELSLPQIGVTLNFTAHNPTHRAAPDKGQLAQIIPVAAAGAGR